MSNSSAEKTNSSTGEFVAGKMPPPYKIRKRPRRRGGDVAPANDFSSPSTQGVSPELTPFLLHALKVCRKYLSSASSSSTPKGENNLTLLTGDAEQTGAVKDKAIANILNRIAEASERQGVDDELKQLRVSSDEAIHDFLAAVKKESTFRSHSKDPTTSSEASPYSPSCASVSCLVFLMDMVQDPTCKLQLRRAALSLSGELLLHSKDCLHFFTTGDKMMRFVSAIGNVLRDSSSSSDDDGHSQERATAIRLQHEAMEMLQHLTKNFGSSYPRLTVATRYLEERKGIIVASVSGDHGEAFGMADLRRGRDLAIQFSEKEWESVRKIVHRADICFEVLVPRFGVAPESGNFRPLDSIISQKEHTESLTQTEAPTPLVDASSAWLDEEDDVAWEDGGEVFDDLKKAALGDNTTKEEFDGRQFDHFDAVEHTLAVMKHTGGVVQGELEIDFDAKEVEDVKLLNGELAVPHVSNQTNWNEAIKTLRSCVDCLATRHMPRLTFWVEALVGSDGMTSVNEKSAGSSLIILPASLRQKRGPALRLLLDAKKMAASVLASASKLGILQSRQRNGGAKPDFTNPTSNGGISLISTSATGAHAYQSSSTFSSITGALPSRQTVPSRKPWQAAFEIQSFYHKHNDGDAKNRLLSRMGHQTGPVPPNRNTKKSRLQIKLRK